MYFYAMSIHLVWPFASKHCYKIYFCDLGEGVYMGLGGETGGKNHWGDLGVDGWIVLGWICGMWVYGLGWARIETCDGRL